MVSNGLYIAIKISAPTRKTADSDGQPQHLKQDHLESRKKRKNPRQGSFTLRSLFECGRVIEQCRVTGPFCFEFASWKFSRPARGIGHAHRLRIDIVEHDPVVALPVHYRRQRPGWEIA